MGVPSTFSSCTKTDRPLALWPVTTVRTFIFLAPLSFADAIALEDAKRIYVPACGRSMLCRPANFRDRPEERTVDVLSSVRLKSTQGAAPSACGHVKPRSCETRWKVRLHYARAATHLHVPQRPDAGC